MSPDRSAPLRGLTRRSLVASLSLLALKPSLSLAAGPKFQRIVTLDYAVGSTLLATGGALAAIAELSDWDKWMGEPKMPPGMINLGSAWEVNFELLALLKPDLIITTPFLEALRPKLEAIAPCYLVSVYDGSGDPILDKSIAETRKMGAHLGMDAATATFLDQADRQFDAYRQRLANHPTRRILPLYLLDQRHAYVYSAPGLYDGALQRLGLKSAWTKDGNYWGFTMVGLEMLADLGPENVHAMLMEPVPGDVLPKVETSPIWQNLPFVKAGRISILKPALPYGMVCEATRFASLLTDALEAHS